MPNNIVRITKKKINEQQKQYYENNKEKVKESRKRYYENNKEKETKRKKRYYENNKEQAKESRKRYYENNKDKVLEQNKCWYENNKEKVREYYKKYYATPQGKAIIFNNNHKRRTREQSQGNGITKDQWLECMNFFGWKCAYSGITLTKENRSIDHITPLSKGGEHEIWNLSPMYRSYNISKHDKDMLQWYKEQPFYSEERLQKIYEWQEYAFNKYACEDEDIQ